MNGKAAISGKPCGFVVGKVWGKLLLHLWTIGPYIDQLLHRNEAPRSLLRGICEILRSRQPYEAYATKGSLAFIPASLAAGYSA